jgi:uncharacterized protein (DUF1778 family)
MADSGMPAKTEHLQIRLTPQQKSALQKQARAAGRDVSSYVLAHFAPCESARVADLLRSMRSEKEHRFALAELNEFLHACPPMAFNAALSAYEVSSELYHLSPYLRNYVTAMIELAAHQKQVSPPVWCADVSPLDMPHFVTPLKSLRAHLLRSSPVPFARRNIFVDSSVGAREGKAPR